MTQPDTLHAQLEAEIRWRLEVARAASSSEDGSTPTGEHWRWECHNCDTPIALNPVTILDELAECPNCGSCGINIQSVEVYPSRSVGDLPHLVTHSAEEIRPVDALYLALHDPADAVRRYEGELGVLERHRPAEDMPSLCTWCMSGTGGDDLDYLPWPCLEITSLARRLGVSVTDPDS